jgi:hypothetical protein
MEKQIVCQERIVIFIVRRRLRLTLVLNRMIVLFSRSVIRLHPYLQTCRLNLMSHGEKKLSNGPDSHFCGYKAKAIQ